MTGERGPESDPLPLRVLKGEAHPSELAAAEAEAEEELEAERPPAPPLKPPPGMSRKALYVWRELIESMGSDTVAIRYKHQLAEYCEAVVRARECRADLATRGLMVKGQKGEMVKNPSNQLLREAVAVMVSLGDRFGLSPAKALDVNKREIVDTKPKPKPKANAGPGRFFETG